MVGAWGLEIDKGRIGLCQIRPTSQGPVVKRSTSLPLSPGVLTPSLTERNVADEQELTSQLRSLLKEAGWRRGRIVLTLPDLACRIGHQDFEELRGTPSEIRQLLCWRLKDRLPFPAQEVRIDYQRLPSEGNGDRLLYLVTREAVIAQYETLLDNVGLEPTRIITRGLALYRLHLAATASGKRLLIALGPSSLVLIYADQGIPRLWRVLPWDDRGIPEDQNSTTERLLRELHETIDYLNESMGVKAPDGLLLMGGGAERLAESVAKDCGLPVHTIPEPGYGIPGDLLAAAGAALLQRSLVPRWISR